MAAVFASLALAACFGGPSARDASGALLFNPIPLRHEVTRHTPDTPYWCFSEVRGATDQTDCSGQQEACAQSLGYSRQGGRTITGGCREADAVFCFTTHVDSDQTHCVASQDECTRNAARARTEIGEPKDVSACVSFDRHASF